MRKYLGMLVVAAMFATLTSAVQADDDFNLVLQFAERLSLQPGSVEEDHLDVLRENGLDDRAINDVVQVVSYFAYINRVADGLGVDLEHDMG